MSMTRRQFITRTGLAAAGSFLGPSLFRSPWLQRALADAIGDRYLLVVFLDGGNDGLNTVPPLANGTVGALRTKYQAVRNTGAGGLQLDSSQLAATVVGTCPGTGTPMALHPGLSGLMNLHSAGRLAVIQGCGYPSYNLSHDESRKTWQTGDPLRKLAGTPTGWMGRYLIQAPYGGTDISSVNIRSEVAGEFIQTTTNVLAFSRLSSFGFPHDTYNRADSTFRKTCCKLLYDAATGGGDPTQQFVGAGGQATLLASDVYPPLDNIYKTARPTWNTGYGNLGTRTARDLREVAKIIYGVQNQVDPAVSARFFEVRTGGYDTHADQGAGSPSDQHYKLLAELGNALDYFYADVENMGIADKLCVVVWSEFSRRITQNATGTDHGSQGPVFVIGGTVNGNVYGNHPNINALDPQGNTSYSQLAGDPYRSTDLRDVFGTILKHWLNVPDPRTIFPVDTGSASTRWTAPNFDMGFLP